MNIIFTNYTGYANQLNKNISSDSIAIDGNFNIDYNTRDTIIKLQGYNVFNYNYCYIPELKRYYFITASNVRRNGLLYLSLHIDVLQTYKKQINNAKIRLKNNSVDNTTIFQSDKIVNDTFTNIMITLGGAK